jgi:hypothetical protein
MIFSFHDLDMTHEGHVKRLLHQCHLPFNGRTVFFMRQHIHDMLTRVMQTRTFESIRDFFPALMYSQDWQKKLVNLLCPLLPMDIPVYVYSLGRPIDRKEAVTSFIESRLDLEKIPPSYKALVDTQKNSFYDIIELEEIPLENVVQLKHTGELMSKTTFLEFIERNTTQWGGYESVGFKSPGGTVFGNLVKYNYDMIEFFPQHHGTLSIRRIKNFRLIPSQEKPSRVVPDAYFELRYMNYISYLPDTPDGRVVLGLMKDAFQKGNLYAFSKNGRIRHGRIHKKTQMSGSVYGYPDDTYLQRVEEELAMLGSSRFVFQFSDTVCGSVPYPWVNEFQIKETEQL